MTANLDNLVDEVIRRILLYLPVIYILPLREVNRVLYIQSTDHIRRRILDSFSDSRYAFRLWRTTVCGDGTDSYQDGITIGAGLKVESDLSLVVPIPQTNARLPLYPYPRQASAEHIFSSIGPVARIQLVFFPMSILWLQLQPSSLSWRGVFEREEVAGRGLPKVGTIMQHASSIVSGDAFRYHCFCMDSPTELGNGFKAGVYEFSVVKERLCERELDDYVGKLFKDHRRNLGRDPLVMRIENLRIPIGLFAKLRPTF